MSKVAYRYVFSADIPCAEVEAALLAALFAAEGLHGETSVQLDAAHLLDAEKRQCVIDASTAVGRDLNRLFLNFVRREHGEDAIRVERMVDTHFPISSGGPTAPSSDRSRGTIYPPSGNSAC